MKKYFLFLSVLIFGFIGCKDENPVSPLIPESPLVSSFDGRFVDWTRGDNHRILFLGAQDYWNSDKVYSSSAISDDGTFSLKNLDIPSASMFVNTAYPQFIQGLSFLENTFTCSDSSAKIVYGYLIIAKDTSNDRVAEVYRKNTPKNFFLNQDSIKSGDFSTEYIYVNKNVNLKGKIRFAYYEPSFKIQYNMTLNYNLNYQKGWNKKVTYVVSQTVTYESSKKILTAEYNYLSIEPGAASWYYYYYW